MFNPGDIVRIARQPGIWVVAELAASEIPPERRWRCVSNQPGGPASRIVGDGDVTVETPAPVFVQGQSVSHDGRTVEVVADLGALVRCLTPASRKPLPGSPWEGQHYLAIPPGIEDVPKSSLVLQNLKTLIEGD
ncbi:hypothetical protein [Oceanibaculum sp.]|uniref:hypothetical protein n=1 Tax=Oceanibaculum sp. TaxID=1903597 RepID=UPI00259127DE|nr:hypothetical protein [Oceanibaculum sp.]MCH2393220.1 hypothetical protein [Oceanibaculum sp.]